MGALFLFSRMAHNNKRTTRGKGYEYSVVLFNCRNARVLGVVLRADLIMWESPKLLADLALVDRARRNVQNRLGINPELIRFILVLVSKLKTWD